MIENINLNGATVSAELHGFMYNNVFGYTGVFKYGSAMEAEIVSNNEIKIKDGLLSNYGRFMRISGYETLAIENGTSGVARTDLIVGHFETDGINESHDLRVIKGASGGAIPSYTTGDLYNGDTVNEMPLYAVHLEGLTVTGLTRMFIPLFSLDELRNNLVNDNLLINSDFRNPINQRGQTSYTGSGNPYTIDRWRSFGSYVEIVDGGIKISNETTQAETYFAQTFEQNISGKYTVTVSVKEKSEHSVAVYCNGTSYNYLHQGVNTFLLEGQNLYNLAFAVVTGGYIVIEYIKLEQGSIATPFVPRPYGEELALCQRYYMKIFAWQSSYPFRGDNNAVCVFLSGIQMRTHPTIIGGAVKFVGIATGIASSNGIANIIEEQTSSTIVGAYQRNNGVEIHYIKANTVVNFGIAVIESAMDLDAEIY